MPKSSSKVLFKLDFFFHVTLYFVLGAQIWNNNTRSLKLNIKSIAQKVLAKSGF